MRKIIPGLTVLYAAFSLLFIWDALFSHSLNYFFPFTGYGGSFLNRTGIDLYTGSYVIGLLLTILYSIRRAAQYGFSSFQGALIGVEIVLFGYLGAKILYTLEGFPASLQNFSFGGVSFFGTVLIMPLAFWLLSRLYHIDYRIFSDYCTPPGIVMLICIRTGCFLGGCCGSYIQWINGNPLILPVQLFECLGDILILGLVLWLEKQYPKNGYLYFLFMAVYALIRFFLEFLRNTPKEWLGLSHGQVFAIIALILAGFILQRLKSARP